MKPTVISNSNATSSNGSSNLQTGTNGITIPVNYEYKGQTSEQHQQQPQFNTMAQQHYVASDPLLANCGIPSSHGRVQRQQQQEVPANFQDFNFETDGDLDMFPRTRLGRMTHDPFGDFGSTTHFGFPQFNTLGRRRINPHNDDDFFNRLPSEFRQYIPESFAHRRTGSNLTGNSSSGQTMVHPQQSTQQQSQSQFYNTMPQSPTRKVCDAAIQTEDPNERSEVDHSINTKNIRQYGVRNTVDMGLKPPSENKNQSPRSSSAPPTEQQQSQQQPFNTETQKTPASGPKRLTPPPQQNHQFATQTSQQVQTGYDGQSPQFQKMYYAPQQVYNPQKQQTPPPQVPGGSFIRTIPIFVEGRSEPIINNKEIPNQDALNVSPGSCSSRAFTPAKQQTYRPKPLNTLEQSATSNSGLLPQTPHTVDTINKIQDIQRDVLDLMSRVEKFKGTRVDKEYVYLDEMLTRNLLKLDNIDTNGKDSIRLARKEAIKCIQASINVLEAKAEENKKGVQINNEPVEINPKKSAAIPIQVADTQKVTSAEKRTKESIPTNAVGPIMEPPDKKIDEPIPLPLPENEKYNLIKIEDCPDDDIPTIYTNKEPSTNIEDSKKYASESK